MISVVDGPIGNTDVMSQRLRRGLAAVALSTVPVLLAGCGGSTPAPATVTVTEKEDDAPTAAEPTRPDASDSDRASQSQAPAAATAVMPDVTCMNLQLAQDTIQDAGVFYSRSEDATGRGRRQVLDRNWIVVSQTPEAGATIGEGDAILSVVKSDEPNDC